MSTVCAKIMHLIDFFRRWFSLSDLSLEEALFDGRLLRQFAGLTLTRSGILNQRRILDFRLLLEEHDLTNKFLQEVSASLVGRDLLLELGTIIDTKFVEALTPVRMPMANGIQRCIKLRQSTSGPLA